MHSSIIQPAGFWIRLGALIVDSLVVSVPVWAVGLLLTGDLTGFDNAASIVEWLYGIILPVIWMGYTVGKRCCGIRIARIDGRKVGLGTMVMRVIVSGLVYAFSLGIAVVVSAFMVGLRNDKRAIHDLIAGTYVTHTSPLKFS
jgi:uncharacterized RDD family membrane protein YckC